MNLIWDRRAQLIGGVALPTYALARHMFSSGESKWLKVSLFALGTTITGSGIHELWNSGRLLTGARSLMDRVDAVQNLTFVASVIYPAARWIFQIARELQQGGSQAKDRLYLITKMNWSDGMSPLVAVLHKSGQLAVA